MIFLDTDILIDILRDYLPAIDWFSKTDRNQALFVTGYTVMELLYGCRNQREVDKASRLISQFNICWAPEHACEEALQHFAKRRLQFNIGVVDALIAETVKVLGGKLYTFNMKHYQAVDHLELLQPYPKQSATDV